MYKICRLCSLIRLSSAWRTWAEAKFPCFLTFPHWQLLSLVVSWHWADAYNITIATEVDTQDIDYIVWTNRSDLITCRMADLKAQIWTKPESVNGHSLIYSFVCTFKDTSCFVMLLNVWHTSSQLRVPLSFLMVQADSTWKSQQHWSILSSTILLHVTKLNHTDVRHYTRHTIQSWTNVSIKLWSNKTLSMQNFYGHCNGCDMMSCHTQRLQIY